MTIKELSYKTIHEDHTNRILKSIDLTVDDIISFQEYSKNYCVGVVDVVNSTIITSKFSAEKISKYYRIFLNSMSIIAKKYGATVVKNVGDGLLFYFPETSSYNMWNLYKAIECGLVMLDFSSIINKKMVENDLPEIEYRVSEDFGSIVTAKSVNESGDDIFGSTVNLCTKINHSANPNEMVIGHDLYQLVKTLFVHYSFEQVKGYTIQGNNEYPVYLLNNK